MKLMKIQTRTKMEKPEEQTENLADQVVKDYLKAKEVIEGITEAYEDKIAPFKAIMDESKQKLLNICKELGTDGLKTPSGSVTRRVSTNFWTSDWGNFYEFLLAHNAPQLLQQRIHTKNMQDFLSENEVEPPEGFQAMSKFDITVRKGKGTNV